MRVAILGATGHTGRIAVRALRERGLRVLACGRSADALASLQGEGVDTRRVDVRSRADVRAALADVDAVANLAGPFLDTGHAPIEEAIARGVPYVDTTGEQMFMLSARRRHDATARAAGVAVVNALAFEYAFADLAARALFPDGGDALHVLYRPRRAQGSAGTKKSIARVLATPSHGQEDGRLVLDDPGAHTHRFATRDGWRDGISFPGGEILTVPAHTDFRTVRTYVPGPASRARTTRMLAPAARLVLRGPVLAAVERVIDARHKPPRNDDARGEIYLTALRGAQASHALVDTPDPYLATGEIVAEGIARLARARGGASGGGGVLAPAQALDAHDTLGALRERMPTFDARRVEVLPEGVVRALGADDKPK